MRFGQKLCSRSRCSWNNTLHLTCSRSMFQIHSFRIYAPGALCIKTCSWSIVHSKCSKSIYNLRVLLQVMNAPGAADPGALFRAKNSEVFHGGRGLGGNCLLVTHPNSSDQLCRSRLTPCKGTLNLLHYMVAPTEIAAVYPHSYSNLQ